MVLELISRVSQFNDIFLHFEWSYKLNFKIYHITCNHISYNIYCRDNHPNFIILFDTPRTVSVMKNFEGHMQSRYKRNYMWRTAIEILWRRKGSGIVLTRAKRRRHRCEFDVAWIKAYECASVCTSTPSGDQGKLWSVWCHMTYNLYLFRSAFMTGWVNTVLWLGDLPSPASQNRPWRHDRCGMKWRVPNWQRQALWETSNIFRYHISGFCGDWVLPCSMYVIKFQTNRSKCKL